MSPASSMAPGLDPAPSSAPPSSTAPQARAAGAGRRVTDAPTRLFHALLALGFLGGWLTGDSESWRALHTTFGYAMGGLVVWRLVYGLVGPRHARLSASVRKLADTGAWLAGFIAGGWQKPAAWTSVRHRLTALSTLLILALVLPLALSGYGTQNEWLGGELLEELHEGLANALLAAVVLHLGTLVLGSLMKRENLARPMLGGRVPGVGPDLVRHNRAWMAAAMLVAVIGLFAWQWQAAPQGLWPSAISAADHGHDEDDDD